MTITQPTDLPTETQLTRPGGTPANSSRWTLGDMLGDGDGVNEGSLPNRKLVHGIRTVAVNLKSATDALNSQFSAFMEATVAQIAPGPTGPLFLVGGIVVNDPSAATANANAWYAARDLASSYGGGQLQGPPGRVYIDRTLQLQQGVYEHDQGMENGTIWTAVEGANLDAVFCNADWYNNVQIGGSAKTGIGVIESQVDLNWRDSSGTTGTITATGGTTTVTRSSGTWSAGRTGTVSGASGSQTITCTTAAFDPVNDPGKRISIPRAGGIGNWVTIISTVDSSGLFCTVRSKLPESFSAVTAHWAGDVGKQIEITQAADRLFRANIISVSGANATIDTAVPAAGMTAQSAHWYFVFNPNGMGHGVRMSANHAYIYRVRAYNGAGHGIGVDSVQRNGETFAGEINDCFVGNCRAEYFGMSLFHFDDMGATYYGSSHDTDLWVWGNHGAYANVLDVPTADVLWTTTHNVTGPSTTAHPSTTWNLNGKVKANQAYSRYGHGSFFNNTSGSIIWSNRYDGNFTTNGNFAQFQGNLVKHAMRCLNVGGSTIFANQSNDFGAGSYDASSGTLNTYAGFYFRFNGSRSSNIFGNQSSSDEDQPHTQVTKPNTLIGFRFVDQTAPNSGSTITAVATITGNSVTSRAHFGQNSYSSVMMIGFGFQVNGGGQMQLNVANNTCAGGFGVYDEIPLDQQFDGGSDNAWLLGSARRMMGNSWQTRDTVPAPITISNGTTAADVVFAGFWPKGSTIDDTDPAAHGFERRICSASGAAGSATWTTSTAIIGAASGSLCKVAKTPVAVTNSTTLQDLLSVSLPASADMTNGTDWYVSGYVVVDAPAATGATKVEWESNQTDTTGEMDFGVVSNAATGSTTAANLAVLVDSTGGLGQSQSGGGAAAGTKHKVKFEGMVNVKTACTIKFRGAQGTANVTATTFYDRVAKFDVATA